MYTFQTNSFISAMLTGAVNPYHFIILSMALTLVEGRNVSGIQNLLASFPRAVLKRAG